MNAFALTKLRRSDLDTLVSWAEQEGWNPGPHDADVFWRTDPHGYWGFFRGLKLIAGGSIVSYGGEFGFMGFFIVQKAYRHQGIGRKLWLLRLDAMRQRLRAKATIGMDGVVAMQPFYARGGFKPAFHSIRMETRGRRFSLHPRIEIMEDGETGNILKLDRECFGYSREAFIRAWLAMPESRTFCFRDKAGLGGFAVMRRAARGYKIGPLFAQDTGVAQVLLQACQDAAGEESLFLDVPQINREAVDLAARSGMKPVFECVRMYNGDPPDIPVGKIFGITSFELG